MIFGDNNFYLQMNARLSAASKQIRQNVPHLKAIDDFFEKFGKINAVFFSSPPIENFNILDQAIGRSKRKHQNREVVYYIIDEAQDIDMYLKNKQRIHDYQMQAYAYRKLMEGRL